MNYKITYKDSPMSIGLFLFGRKKDQSIVVKEYYFENQDKNSDLYVNEKHFTKEYTDMCFSDEIRYHNGIGYKMMSLESIYNSKKNSRPKDRYDAEKIKDSIDIDKENKIEQESKNIEKIIKDAPNNCVINLMEKEIQTENNRVQREYNYSKRTIKIDQERQGLLQQKRDIERKQLLEQKNNLEQQKNESLSQDKGEARKLVPNKPTQNSGDKNGFTNVILLSLITSGFVVLVAILTSLFIK